MGLQTRYLLPPFQSGNTDSNPVGGISATGIPPM
jgi:hypothetical protein